MCEVNGGSKRRGEPDQYNRLKRQRACMLRLTRGQSGVGNRDDHDVPIATRASFQPYDRPMTNAPMIHATHCTMLRGQISNRDTWFTDDATHVAKVMPAKPLTFCGFSLRPDVNLPVCKADQNMQCQNQYSDIRCSCPRRSIQLQI